MRLAVKSVLFLLLVYVVFLVGVAAWLNHSLRSVSTTLITKAARIIGTEVARTITRSAIGDLVEGDPVARQQLAGIVATVTEHSDVVEAIAVVDETGAVAASGGGDIGQHLAVPAVIFRPEGPIEIADSKLFVQGGQYHLFVPLADQGHLLGYVRLSINSRPLAKLYYAARREFVLAALIGVFGVGALGFFLHIQLSRRSATLTEALERALGGEPVALPERRDEFAQAVAAARKVGTQLTAAREQSSQAARRLGALAKAMDVGVILLHSDKHLDFANAAARELLGFAAPGTLEHQWDAILARVEAAGRAAGDGGHRSDIEVDLPRNGQDGHLRVSLTPLGDGAEGYLMIVKSREMIEALEHELGLAIQMRGLASFYMGVVHDLKTPLHAMVMNIELLKETLARSADAVDRDTRARQSRYLEVLRDEVERLDRQLRALLVNTAPTKQAEVIDLADLVRELVTLVGPQAKRQRVEIETAVPDTVVSFTGNRDRLKQAVLNIAVNALEAMPNGGHLAIRLEHDDGQIRLSLRDSGPGMSPELESQIYNVHFTTKSGGTGIGLYVARSVVAAHGGDIRIDTAPGAGTCFQIWLPAVPSHT